MEGILVVDVNSSDSEEPEMTQPKLTVERLRDLDDDWTSFVHQEEEPQAESDTSTLRTKSRRGPRKLFTDPEQAGSAAKDEIALQTSGVNLPIGGPTLVEAYQQALSTKGSDVGALEEANKEKAIETEEARQRKRRIREEKRPFEPPQKMPRIASGTISIREPERTDGVQLPRAERGVDENLHP